MQTTFWVLLTAALLVTIFTFATRELKGRNLQREASFRHEYSQWQCPNCELPFGDRVHYIKYGGTCSDVIIVCPKCRFLNRFDHTGRPEFGRGELFEPDKYDRWEKTLPSVVCPQCGTEYGKWPGVEIGGIDASGEFVGAAIVQCPRCNTEAFAVDRPEGFVVSTAWPGRK